MLLPMNIPIRYQPAFTSFNWRRQWTYCVVFLTASLVTPSIAAAQPLIANVYERKHQNLRGDWPVIVDPYDSGIVDYRRRPRIDGFFLDATTKNDSDLIEYQFTDTDTLKVPGDWNTQRQDLFYYEGSVWYRRHIEHRPSMNRRYILRFGAANYRANMYLNGNHLGDHEGGFTPFEFEVSDQLRAGRNSLVVRVDNRRLRDGVPTDQTDWWNYGGITRDVLLIDVPMTFIRNYLIQLDPEDSTQITGWVQLDGAAEGARVEVSIPEAGITRRMTVNKTGRCEFRIRTDTLQYWHPDAPKLYDVIVRTELDEVKDRIGFRWLDTSPRRVLLNGKPIYLRGICLHEEALSTLGRAYTRDHARELLTLAKSLNCNFVRLAHYPHNEWMLRSADEMGLMIWAEIPVYWTVNFKSPPTLANAQQQLAAMIDRDRNRAAVAIWSVANETPRGPDRLKFLKALITTAREMDRSRLISAALETRYKDSKTIVVDDPLGSELDVLGCNEYVGWYDGLPEKAATLSWQSAFKKPLIISEFGAGAKFGVHGPAAKRWTEEYQVAVYREQISMLQKIPFLAGTSPWILKDFRSPRRLLPQIQDGWNRKGLVSETGEKKQAFFVLRDWYEKLEVEEDQFMNPDLDDR